MKSSESDYQLRPVSNIVLGLLATAGPQTSYELKQNVEGSVGFFWRVPHSQLYAEPQRLHYVGLVTATQETESRRRRTFEITDEGRRALIEWPAHPAEASQIRDPSMLRLFFMDAAPELVRPLAQRRADSLSKTLEFLEQPERGGDQVNHRRVLRWGRHYMRANLAFWRSLLEEEDPRWGVSGRFRLS